MKRIYCQPPSDVHEDGGGWGDDLNPNNLETGY